MSAVTREGGKERGEDRQPNFGYMWDGAARSVVALVGRAVVLGEIADMMMTA